MTAIFMSSGAYFGSHATVRQCARAVGAASEILLLGTCELLILKVAPHAAVDAANQLAAADPKAVHFKPLVNAVLRRIVREGADVMANLDQVRLCTPDWLWARWTMQYGEAQADVRAYVQHGGRLDTSTLKIPAP